MILVLLALSGRAVAQDLSQANGEIRTGAEQIEAYLPIIKDKKLALVINQASRVGERSLLDTLLALGLDVRSVWVPEHGFRGEAEAGELIRDGKDAVTGTPILSLYGKSRKPADSYFKGVDMVVYDLQDVGVRFYTYISTLEYVMEACARQGVPLLLLDRPNPLGHYVDGPVLDTAHRSFVGRQPIPIVYGMTPAEYAQMLVGEQWFEGAASLEWTAILCQNYDHLSRYYLPVRPSPNLQSMAAIYCYPSLCLFEGTVISVGRGTDKPFQHWGHPSFKGRTSYGFIPRARSGSSQKPLYMGQMCYGQILALDIAEAERFIGKQIQLGPLMKAYSWYQDKDKFFNHYFTLLAGSEVLEKQIREGWSEEAIRASWEPGLEAFRQLRRQYLLYPDFDPQ